MLSITLLDLLQFIRTNWIYLPKELQLDLVDLLEDYKDMIKISKYERSRYNG